MPKLLHARYDGHFQRVQLPFMTPLLAAGNTGTFEDNGMNPIKVDFPTIEFDSYSQLSTTHLETHFLQQAAHD